ncbi:MAG TPA: PAN domain-containing protein [Thermoanaerobaculia bacterium]|nr:PAN domain-containing protein [Thermoanaerobaculia bacterium]
MLNRRQHSSAIVRVTAALAFSWLASPAAAFPNRYTQENGFDRPGADYETFEQTGDYQSHVLCRDACESQPRCRSYTYVKPGVAGAKALCRLKSAVPAPVESPCCISAVKGGKPKQPAVPSFSLQWLGWDADEVGRQGGGPDGAPDHRLRLSMDPKAAQDVVAITLQMSDEQGIPADDLVWSTRHGADPFLAAKQDGRRLNAAAAPRLGRFTGPVVLDLFAHDIGQWQVDQHLLVRVTLAGGRELVRWTRLEPPPDRLLGIWQMHCPSSSPEAFEPMTLSGRLQLVRQADGGLSGFFGALPLTGKLDPSGEARGTAAAGEESVTWEGRLTAAARGKPLRGSGTFRFLRTAAACSGDGVWGSKE